MFTPVRERVTSTTLVALAFALAWLGAIPAARAGNDDEILVGNDAALTGGAVTASVNDGSALFYNPSGLAGVSRDQVDVSASAFVVRLYNIPELLQADGGDGGRGDSVELVSVPSSLSYVRPLSPKVRAAFGVFVPRSLDVAVRSRLTVDREGNEEEWVAALGATIKQYRVGPGIGWQVTPKLATGVSLLGVYSTAFVSSLFAGGGGLADRAEEGFVDEAVLASEVNLGLQAVWGVQLEVPRFRFGFAVQSPAIAVASFTRITAATLLATSEGNEFAPVDIAETNTELHRLLPLRVRSGAAYLWPGGWVALDVDYQGPLSRPFLGDDRQSVVNGRIGGKQRVSESVLVGAGAFSDRSAALPPRQYADLRVDFYGATLGFEITNRYRLAKGQPASKLAFSSTFALRYAFGSGEIGGVRLAHPQSPDSAPVFTNSRITVHEIGLHLGSGLYF